MNLRVSNVTPLEGYKLRIEFSNGDVGKTVAWPNEQGMCPDTFYLDSVKFVEQV